MELSKELERFSEWAWVPGHGEIEQAKKLERSIAQLLAVHDRLLNYGGGFGYIDCRWPPEGADEDINVELFRAIENLRQFISTDTETPSPVKAPIAMDTPNRLPPRIETGRRIMKVRIELDDPNSEVVFGKLDEVEIYMPGGMVAYEGRLGTFNLGPNTVSVEINNCRRRESTDPETHSPKRPGATISFHQLTSFEQQHASCVYGGYLAHCGKPATAIQRITFTSGATEDRFYCSEHTEIERAIVDSFQPKPKDSETPSPASPAAP